MRSFLPAVLLIAAAPLPMHAAAPANPAAELAAFSVFQNVDPAQLSKSDVKAERGPAMSNARDLSVQSGYVLPGTPAQALEALRKWDASRHRELKIYLHADLPASPAPGDFARLRSAPANGAVRSLDSATQKMASDLQVSRDEAKTFAPGGAADGGAGGLSDGVAAFWSNLLAARAQAFIAGGAASQPAYDHTAQSLKPSEAFASLLRQQEKIRRQFAGLLAESGVTGGRPSLSPESYYELIDVDDDGVLTLGAFSSKPAGSGFQAAEVSYYASGGYDVSLTLYQMWPVDVGGHPSTLVWRGDLISSVKLASLHGVERLGSESAMIKDVSKAVILLKRDTAGSR